MYNVTLSTIFSLRKGIKDDPRKYEVDIKNFLDRLSVEELNVLSRSRFNTNDVNANNKPHHRKLLLDHMLDNPEP